MFRLTGPTVLLCAGHALADALPMRVPLRFDQGFWNASFSVGPQNFNLSVDTGSFAVIIGQGLYKPNPTSVQTNMGEFIQFNGANEDGTLMASETFFFVRDEIDFAGVSLSDFLVGNITVGDPIRDGILGLSPPASQITDPNDPTFLAGQSLAQTICSQQSISPCEFGLELKFDGTGSLIFGPMNDTMITGNITTLKTQSNDAWITLNDTAEDSPLLVINDQPFTHIIAIFDNGTPNIIGPIETVRAALLSVGYNISETSDSSGASFVFGTYDCASPARFGFSFPPSTEVHYIDAGANVLNRTADGLICTANILGASTTDLWLIGQTWFQGRYVQHNLNASTLAFADLADA
ncbi:acid protease [Vararia minispora EC-137]|uniref:Acid protease n=1 Tax=Vararia minispora EC-137 TaxID=1314806 RepID=A0ACB8QH40_9AGAM|nr:acid protease [Vararia minispora EC-137]